MPPSPGTSGGRVSGPRVVAQVRYGQTTEARATGGLILSRKCRNSAALLKKFLPYHRRYPARAHVLESSVRALERYAASLAAESPAAAGTLFLREAHAARAYWKAVQTLLAQHDARWTRRYPHARDPINLLLNIGYTLLARWVREEIREAGLLPDIGVFHAVREGSEPLVYDLMELFRQPAVDVVVIPLFTKKKRGVDRVRERDMRRAVAGFREQWERPFWYRGQCLPLRRIAQREIVSLSRAMVRKEIWEPYRHPWGHGWTCVNYRVSANVKRRLRLGSRQGIKDKN